MPTLLDSEGHVFRLEATLKFGIVSLGAIALFWSGYALTHDEWAILPFSCALICAAVWTEWLLAREKRRLASYILFALASTIVTIASIFIDLPTGDTPRATHNYFLVLGIFAWIVFKEEKSWIRYLMIAYALSLFAFFASHSWGVETVYALTHAGRLTSVWIHNFTVMALLLALLWMTQTRMRFGDVAVSSLKTAISEKQFVLFYQPQAGDDGRVVGGEALLRWAHPEKGMMSPALFMPVAERSGLILEIGQWVLDTACEQLAVWAKDHTTAHLHISVNVSALQFKQPDYVEKVLASLEKSHANPKRLTLELTESMLVDDINDLTKKMQALRAKGIKLSLDDFGTGYSSLSYLKTLPLDQLKIDQSFVRDMLTDDSDRAIVRTVIELAKSLNLHLIAEGVETELQRQFLASLGCHSFQGYLLGKPAPISYFDQHNRAQSELNRPVIADGI
ncbi:EAL domain-containing protein [uncultured Oxalicibacterium sp.]|uniref:putative bifunctional diguanylate cyclase/phosphodiesterase n=1 Tax=uncultured Oxalicibacterium sp. TaxID=1168540 RepID=UPI0025DDD930|nr:EAL domain-containing protein [uncultured Oxalicibacterium sp.]